MAALKGVSGWICHICGMICIKPCHSKPIQYCKGRIRGFKKKSMKTSCLHLQYKYCCVPHLSGYKIKKPKIKKKQHEGKHDIFQSRGLHATADGTVCTVLRSVRYPGTLFCLHSGSRAMINRMCYSTPTLLLLTLKIVLFYCLFFFQK